MQQNDFYDMQQPEDRTAAAQEDFPEQPLPPARWDYWTDILTLSGEPKPVRVPRPIEWRTFDELPENLRKMVSQEQTSVQSGVGCFCYFVPFFDCVILWSMGIIHIDFLDFLLLIVIVGSFLLLLAKLFLIDRAVPQKDLNYVWFYGQVDDLVVRLKDGQNTMFPSLSVNGYEIPLQINLPSVYVSSTAGFSDSSKWLLNTDIIIVQEDNIEGVTTPNLLIFPAKNNKLINNESYQL